MLKFVKNGAFMLFVASLAVAGLTSCDDDDPFENVTPPTVEVAPNTVSGVVTSKKGDVLAGATVTMGSLTASTDGAGVYKFDNVAAGSYNLKAEAKGMLAAEGKIVVADNGKTQNMVWNAVLASAEVQKKVAVKKEEKVETEVQAEAIKGNDKAEVKVEAEIPAAAVETEDPEEEVEIILTPIYDASQAARGGDNTMLTGTTLSCSNPKAKIKKAIALAFNVDASLKGATAMKFANGKWVAAESKVEGSTVIIMADEFASYGLFLNVSFASAKGSVLEVANETFNNLYGAAAMTANDVKYTYKAGLEISAGNNTLNALLVEKLAGKYGATVSTLNGSYKLGVLLPIGTMLQLTAVQATMKVSASAAGSTVSATLYGAVSVTTTTANRQHSGGMN